MSPTVRTACTRHCGDGCSLLVESGQDGKVLVRGNPEHPFTKGFICAKTARFGERLRSPRRITAPLVRDGEGLREASWEEALGLVAEQIGRLRATPERMLHVFYYGSFGILHQASKRLFTTLGASTFSGSPCLSAGIAAMNADFGEIRQGPLAQVEEASRVVNWGRNASAQSVHLEAMLARARARGARVVCVHPGDPGYAGYGEDVVLIRPGTDRFLAAAVLKSLARRGHVSMEALARCRHGERFLEFLDSLDQSALLAACGVDRAKARLLETLYDGSEPTATLIGRGLQRYGAGGANVRFIDALAMLSGNVGRPGGGVYFARPDQRQAAWKWADAKPGYSRSFPVARLAQAVEAATPPVEFVWVEGMNPVTQLPDSLATKRMLEERFTVVVEPFMTDTARCARVILPPAIMLECEDMVKNDAHQCVNHAARVFEPMGLSLPNFEIAARLGAMLSPAVGYPSPEEVMDQALRKGRLAATLAELREKGFLCLDVPATPWEDGVFAHKDGLYRLPESLPPAPPADPDFPLMLLSTIRKGHLLSQVPEDEQETPPRVYVSPACAALEGLDPSRPALLESVLGSMEVKVETLDGLHPDAVYYPRGDWLSRGGCVNRLIRPLEADMGGQVAYHEERARLRNA